MRNDSVWDEIALVFVAVFTAPLLITWLVGNAEGSHRWLLDHHLVVPGDQAVLDFGGVGVDMIRIVMISGIFAAMVLIAALAWNRQEPI